MTSFYGHFLFFVADDDLVSFSFCLGHLPMIEVLNNVFTIILKDTMTHVSLVLDFYFYFHSSPIKVIAVIKISLN